MLSIPDDVPPLKVVGTRYPFFVWCLEWRHFCITLLQYDLESRITLGVAVLFDWSSVPVSERKGPLWIPFLLNVGFLVAILQLVYDKDTFKADDFMGEGAIDIQPLLSTARANEKSGKINSMLLGKWVTSKEDALVKNSVINLVNGKVKQELTLRLQKVETGELEIELECVPLTQ